MDYKSHGQEAISQGVPLHSTTSQRVEEQDPVVIIEEKIIHPNGETSIRKYSKGKLLGKGGFAKCYEFVNLDTKKTLAAKVIHKSSLSKSRAKQKLLSEIKIHKSLNHPNIVKFEHVFEDSDSVYILLEICSNQTLNELIKKRKKLHELEVQCYVVQIINALKYLREVRVIHRDLKLGNLFLNDKMELKVADFGLAARLEFDGEKRRTVCGTPNYIAPEVLDGKIGHSYEVDIWSLGVIIYTLIIGRPPYETPDVKTTYKKIKTNNYSFPENAQISDPARNLITRILNLDPAQRPSLEDILNHPFISYGGVIPKTLPISSLNIPLPASYISQYTSQSRSTSNLSSQVLSDKLNLMNTDKVYNSSQEENLMKEPSSKTLQGQFNKVGTFNSTSNPNNQAMIATTNDVKYDSTKQFASGDRMLETGLAATSSLRTPRADVWVVSWVDYSSKYGLGYILSNGCAGVFFNDSTKAVFEPNGRYFEYIEKRTSEKTEEAKTYTMTNYPKELHKKAVLLQHFKSYLEGENAQKKKIYPDLDEESKRLGMVYVRKWLKTKHAVMFRLTNKIVQVKFTDKTEIILSSEHKIVVYTNKKGERSEYPLATAMDDANHEMAKRLKYTKDILTNMLNVNQKDREPNKEDNE